MASSGAGAAPAADAPASPAATDVAARDAALLRGEVTCALPALMTAYATGVTATRARNNATGTVAWDGLKIEELPRLLSRDVSPQLRRLALATVTALAERAAAGDAAALNVTRGAPIQVVGWQRFCTEHVQCCAGYVSAVQQRKQVFIHHMPTARDIDQIRAGLQLQ